MVITNQFAAPVQEWFYRFGVRRISCYRTETFTAFLSDKRRLCWAAEADKRTQYQLSWRIVSAYLYLPWSNWAFKLY